MTAPYPLRARAGDGQESREVSASVLEFIRRVQVLHRVSSSLLGPVDPSFRALSGRPKVTVRRHKFNKDSLSKPLRGLELKGVYRMYSSLAHGHDHETSTFGTPRSLSVTGCEPGELSSRSWLSC